MIAFNATSNGIEEIAGTQSYPLDVTGDTTGNYMNFATSKLVNLRVDGGSGDDEIIGSNLSADVLYGGSGNDVVYGGLFNDQIYGESNNDTLYGGSGDDVVEGGYNNDKIYGSEGNDLISGGYDTDELKGEAGNDTLYGGYGLDNLNGGSGNDKLYGEADVDTLLGGDGLDQLSGGGGYDIFDYNAATESKPGSTLRDVILDFAGVGTALGDKIDLAGIDANTGVSADQAFTFKGSGSITGPAQVRVQASGADTLLQANTGGTTAPEMEILLKAASGTWHASDFIL
jgi:Ca2+-binding RTX toxin-like protein